MPFGLFGSLLGSFLDYDAQMKTNTSNRYAQYDTNLMNRDIARETNATNMALNQANIAMQERQNEINRQREDDAVRRRVNDLVGAGLSKTLAAGSPASANAMAAPQNTFGAQVGNPMVAPKASAYKGFETAAYHAKQAMIADKELDLKDKQIDVDIARLDEEARHNKANEAHNEAVLEETKRYNDLVNYWNEQYYNQDASFHKDAVRLEESKQRLSYLSYLNDVDQKEIMNTWYSGQLLLQKGAAARDFMRMTADVAETSAHTATYLADVDLTKQQIVNLKAEVPYISSLIAGKYAEINHLNATTKETLTNVLTKQYNLLFSFKDHSKTTDTGVGESVADQNAKNRHTDLAGRLISGAIGVFSVGAAIFLGAGGGKFLQKALGWDDHHDLYGDR